ncbi:MAG: hypothetical protein KME31_09170 [Tolypothrix carrinoi HA7290-LM1]|nr:hypothetical protein [Tolypothrix carrinoi HA7290-LM1]
MERIVFIHPLAFLNFFNSQCPMTADAPLGPTPRPHSQTYAQLPITFFPIPNAQCPMPYAQCPTND